MPRIITERKYTDIGILKQRFDPKVLLVTVTTTETRMLNGQLVSPIDVVGIPEPLMINITKDGHTYLLARLGLYNCIAVRSSSDMGAPSMQDLVKEAAKLWKPTWALVGALAPQKLGDVIAALHVLGYFVNDRADGSGYHTRAPVAPAGEHLKDRLLAAEGQWYPQVTPDLDWYPGGITGMEPSHYSLFVGDVISAGVLLNDPAAKKQLLDRAKREKRKPAGGDMEGWGLHYGSRVSGHCEWTMIKGICDWGDEQKHDGYQELAMFNAIDVVRFILDNPTAMG